MRVAFYQGTFQPGQDGTMTVMTRMVAAMEREGIDHQVFTPLPPPPGSDLRTPVVPLRRVAFPAYKDYAIALPRRADMWRRLDAYRPDLVQIGTPDLGGWTLLRWAETRGIPAIGAYHTHFPTYLRYYGMGFLEGALWRYFRRVYNACARTLVPTRPVMEELAAHGIQRTVRWPRGVDTARYSPARRSSAIRRAAGVPEDGLLFAYAGRLVSEKNVEAVAAAWALIRAACPRARFMWIGDGPRREVVRRLAPDSFFPGYLLGDELASAWASADVLVFCSVTETFGNVILEGMASGLPAIAVAGTGPGSIVEEAGGGITVPAPDPALIAAAMRRLHDEPGLLGSLREAALAHAQRQSWDAVFAGQFATYREVLDERAPRG